MEVYLVRHGQTNANRKHYHQRPDSSLNEKGHGEAEAVAKILSTFSPTHLISSPFFRTRQTAEYIKKETGLEPQMEEVFTEIHRPLDVYGKPYTSLASFWYFLRWLLSGNGTYKDEIHGESYGAFLLRIGDARKLLESLPSDSCVVVVSHAFFINFFVHHICNEKPLPIWRASFRFLKILAIKNGSITHLTYEKAKPGNRVCTWHVTTYDNTSHLSP